MRRFLSTFAAAVGTAVAVSAPALAQGSYPPDPPAGTTILRENGGELAFTGADISVWALVAGALILAGIVALVLGRRRAAAAE